MLATVVTAKDWRESESDGNGSTLDISKDASHAAKEKRVLREANSERWRSQSAYQLAINDNNSSDHD